MIRHLLLFNFQFDVAPFSILVPLSPHSLFPPPLLLSCGVFSACVPGRDVQSVELPGDREAHTLLRLQADTEYIVTVIALYDSDTEGDAATARFKIGVGQDSHFNSVTHTQTHTHTHSHTQMHTLRRTHTDTFLVTVAHHNNLDQTSF